MTIEIPLSQGKVALIDDEDYDLVSKYKWHLTHYGYAAAYIPGTKPSKYIKMHTLLTNEKITDHKNRDKLDNRRNNLRPATLLQNNCNVEPYGIVGYKGVVYHIQNGKTKFRAQIGHNYKNNYLGVYDTPEEAARAYNKKAIELYGEFAYINDV